MLRVLIACSEARILASRVSLLKMRGNQKGAYILKHVGGITD